MSRWALRVMHWHGDTLSFPIGRALLAWSDAHPHQTIRVGERAYGLQSGARVRAVLGRLVRCLAGISGPPSPSGGAGD